MKHIESYVDSSIKLPQNLPVNILAILEMLEETDKKSSAPILYFDRLDDLWVIAKNSMADNFLSKENWNIIVKKYWIHANAIWEKEKENGYF